MHRKIVYRGQIPYETDTLYSNRYAMEALGLLAADLLGISTLVAGCGCAPTSPTSLSVKVSPGRIYSQQDLDDSDYGAANGTGGLPLDNNADHKIVKQGLLRDTTTLALTAPTTAGQSVNWLIQAAFSEVDADPVVLPFFNASAPDVPWAGPDNSGGSLNTTRKDSLVLTTKQGSAATTGSQTTPAPDAGCVGLWVVTIAQGQTTIVSGNIAQYSSAPFLTETLVQKISQATADARYSKPVDTQTQAGNYGEDAGTQNAVTITLAPAPGSWAALKGVPVRVLIKNTAPDATALTPNTVSLAIAGLSGTKAIKRPGGKKLFYNDLVAGNIYTLIYDGTQFQVQELMAAAQIGSGLAPPATSPNDGSGATIYKNPGNVGQATLQLHIDNVSNTLVEVINFKQYSDTVVRGARTSENSLGSFAFPTNNVDFVLQRTGGPASVIFNVIVLASDAP